MAVSFKGGVILGADSRTSTGNYIANRVTDKITPLSDNVYILRSGSAADTQAIAGHVQMYIAQHQAEAGEQITTKTAAHMAMQMAYSNKDFLQVRFNNVHAICSQHVCSGQAFSGVHTCAVLNVPTVPFS